MQILQEELLNHLICLLGLVCELTVMVTPDMRPILFDSLIAKVITYSSEDNFKQACKRNYRSLCEFKIKGVPTNIEILKNVLINKEFLNNKVHTNFFENNLKDLLSSHNHQIYQILLEASRRKRLNEERLGILILWQSRSW